MRVKCSNRGGVHALGRAKSDSLQKVHLGMFGSMLEISDMCTIDHACSDLDCFRHIWIDLERTGKILQDTKGYNGMYTITYLYPKIL